MKSTEETLVERIRDLDLLIRQWDDGAALSLAQMLKGWLVEDLKALKENWAR